MPASPPIQIPAGYLDPRTESLPTAPVVDKDHSRQLDGVIIPVWAGDVYLAKACCASVRQHLGNIPITLLVDGPATDTGAVQQLHGVQRLVVQDIADAEILPLCSGTPWTKLLPFWASPYERFLCLDADTLVWGDLRAYADFEKYDFIAGYHFTRQSFQTEAEVDFFVYDTKLIQKNNPQLDWRGREFANSGFFFARRGVFPKMQLLTLRKWDCWRCYDQGLLNYLRWQAESSGSPRMGGVRIQLFPAEQTYEPADRFLPRNYSRPAIIHWIGKKPKLGHPFRAAQDSRKQFLQMTGRSRFSGPRLFLEDLSTWLQRHHRSLLRRWRGQPKKH